MLPGTRKTTPTLRACETRRRNEHSQWSHSSACARPTRAEKGTVTNHREVLDEPIVHLLELAVTARRPPHATLLGKDGGTVGRVREVNVVRYDDMPVLAQVAVQLLQGGRARGRRSVGQLCYLAALGRSSEPAV